MNPGEFQNNIPIRNPVLNPFLSANTSLLQNQPILNFNQNLNSSSAQLVQEKHEIIKDQNGTKIIEEKKYELNSVPFKSLIKEETTKIINSSTNINNTNNTPVNNPFANDLKLNDISPNHMNLNKNRNSTYKIELFRSQNKSGEKSPDKTPFNNVQVINLGKKNLINDERYKILVKKIANQLRKRIKLPTSKILKIYESYVILIKRIAKALKASMDKKIKVNKINKIEEEKTNTVIEKPIEIIEENKIIIKKPESKKNSKSKRKIEYNMTLLRKSEEEKEMILKEQQMMNLEDKIENKQELNLNQDDNINLSNIEVTKSNFIQDFKKFLDKENISLVNNLPVTINQKSKLYLEQNNFWYLILNYIFYQDNNLSFYNILSFLDKYFLWCTEKTKDNFASIKKLILDYITKNFSTEKINQFLFMNKLTNIEKIFEKYESSINTEEKANKLKQEKIYELNFINNVLPECNCDLCQNEIACVKKVADMNKNKIQIIKGQNINIIGNNKELLNKNNEMDIDSGEEIYFKGISAKKNNKIFTASKTRLSENTNFVYTSTTLINNIKNDSDEKNKTFKNISKRKNKISEENKQEEKEEIKQEEKEETKEEEKEEEKEEKEEKEEETKNKKKSRKTKKDKSRNKNKNKKRDSSKSDKNEDENEEKEKEEEKHKKKKKTKKYKNSNNDNDSSKEDDTEDKEKEEQKSRNRKKSRTKKNKNSRKKEDSDEKDDDSDESLNKNSKRKKSKTPKNKRSQNIN